MRATYGDPVDGSTSETVGGIGVRTRLIRMRARVRSLPGGAVIWRIGITAVGVLVIVVGVILLPLPGPGWLIIFAGLGLLATEYPWAARLLAWARRHATRSTRWAARQHGAVRVLLVVATLIFLAALVLGTWWLYTVV